MLHRKFETQRRTAGGSRDGGAPATAHRPKNFGRRDQTNRLMVLVRLLGGGVDVGGPPNTVANK